MGTGWASPIRPSASPSKAATVRLTCACGTIIPEAWGPKTEVTGRVRVETCPNCGRVMRLYVAEVGMPMAVAINPIDPDVAIADWGD